MRKVDCNQKSITRSLFEVRRSWPRLFFELPDPITIVDDLQIIEQPQHAKDGQRG